MKNLTENKQEALLTYPLNARKQTIERMDTLESRGYRFVAGNNWRLGKNKKWENYICIKVAQTNSKSHGKCIATMWAVKHI